MDKYDALRESVTVPAVINKYLSSVRIRNNRIPCPFHGGTHYNLAFTDRVWYCHVCHSGGDVIEFVRQLLHLRFPETVLRISADFGVPVGGKRASPLYERKIQRELAAMQKRREEAISFSDAQVSALTDLRRFLFNTCCEDAQSVIDDLDALLDRHASSNELFTWDVAPMVHAIKQQYEVENEHGDNNTSAMDA